MIFHPHIKTVASLGLACLAAGVVAAYMSVQRGSVIFALGSTVAFLGAVILLGPVLRNQTIEVRAESIVVRTFWHAVELRHCHLTEVVRRRGGARSYRFQSSNLFYQVSPIVYHNGDILQLEFDRLFEAEEVGPKITEQKR